MKKEITSLQKFLAIRRVLRASGDVFENKPGAQQAKDLFIEQTNQLASSINLLVRPAGTMLIDRREQRADLKIRLAGIAHLGVLMAGRMHHDELRLVFLHYVRKIPAVSSAMMAAIGLDMMDLFDSNATQADNLGLDATTRADIRTVLTNFSELLFSTQSLLDTRRADQATIRSLISSCNSLLRDELDHFARFSRETHPLWYASYMRLRRKRRRSKSTVQQPAEQVIEGHVTNAQTGQPIPEATIRLVEQNQVTTTDTTGQFKLRTEPSEAATLSCYHAGFRLSTQYLHLHDPNTIPKIHFALEPG